MKNVLWTYDHPAARQQEMLLFKSQESSVIPLLDKSIKWEDYHNEGALSYPVWQDNVSIPLEDVYLVRTRFSCNPDQKCKELVKKYFQYIFINTNQDAFRQLIKWYDGIILWRLNGGPNSTLLSEELDTLIETIEKFGAKERFIFLPSHSNLFLEKFLQADIRTIKLPVYVDQSRITASYLENSSECVSVAISYLSSNPFFKEHLKNLLTVAASFPQLNFLVYGKNETSLKIKNVHIVGEKCSKDYWSGILGSRVFLDIGENEHHTIFPPFEVMSRGMPVIFSKRNGHFRALGYLMRDSPESYGFFDSHESALNYAYTASSKDLRLLNDRQLKLFEKYMNFAIAKDAALEAIGLKNTKSIGQQANVYYFITVSELVSILRKKVFELLRIGKSPMTLKYYIRKVYRLAFTAPMSSKYKLLAKGVKIITINGSPFGGDFMYLHSGDKLEIVYIGLLSFLVFSPRAKVLVVDSRD